MHIVLCGDSVFDNQAYVRKGEPDVVGQVRGRLGEGDSATLLAVDGHEVANVADQMRELPEGASHVFVSVGGNDALGHLWVFQESVRVAGDAYARLHDIRTAFGASYRAMLEGLREIGLPLTLCTIYHPRFDGKPLSRLGDDVSLPAAAPLLQRMAMGALTAFNDAITHEAFAAGLPLIDLRILCDQDEDFANPIEPSARGGQKIANAIVNVARQHDFSESCSRVFTR